MHPQYAISFLAYFAILLGIGIFAHKKQTSGSGFIMGNRSLNFWLTALSAHASDMSAWLFMGFPAAIFLGGFSKSWIAIGLLGGMFFNWQFISKKLRVESEKLDSYTMPTFFEKKFKDTTGAIRLLTATISLFFLTAYLAAALIGMGKLFDSVFGIDYYVGLTIASVVVMLYTFVGGFVTVAWTDLFQALFLLAVIIVVPIVTYSNLPAGFSTIQAAAQAKNIPLGFFEDFSFDTFLGIFFLMTWGLGYFGQPHIITKFMGIKDASQLNKSKYVGMTWQLIALSGAALIGFVGIGFFQNGLANPELVFIEIVKTLFNPLIGGFIMCAFIAANLSTMDSMVLVCASVFSEDLYKRFYKKDASEKQLLRMSRVGVVLVSLISLAFAFRQNTTVLEATRYAWSGLGCSFGPLLLMALYSKHINRYGAIAGILVGSFFAGAWHLMVGSITSYPVPPEIPGFFLSLAAIYVVSRMTRNKVKVGIL